MISDLDGRFLEGSGRTLIEGLKAEEVQDASSVGEDISFDGLVVSERFKASQGFRRNDEGFACDGSAGVVVGRSSINERRCLQNSSKEKVEGGRELHGARKERGGISRRSELGKWDATEHQILWILGRSNLKRRSHRKR